MNFAKLRKTFNKIEQVPYIDYAITDTDKYGDCQSCVNSKLCNIYGVESKGVWVKHWKRGMNASRLWKDEDELYIAHDITEEQFKQIYEIFIHNGYKVQPSVYDPLKSIMITEE